METAYLALLLCFIISTIFPQGRLGKVEGDVEDLTLPDGFLIGSATSAYQIEGAWNVSDKSESTWDWFVHTKPEGIADQSTGDIACDSYNKYKEDVEILNEIGFDFYRFSISWTRVLPTGYTNVVSKDGVKYYHDLLDELEAKGIEPYVTLYHWDHPHVFDELGGWTNNIIVELFADYARFVFQEYGHRVKMFATINEPITFCGLGYGAGQFAPGIESNETRNDAVYLCGHNVLKAHSRAYHIYNDEFRAKQKGKVGIVIPCQYYFPKNKNENFSSELAFQFECGWSAHPVFSKKGDYPKLLKDKMAEIGKQEGRFRLPTFNKFWVDYIRGTADYFGLNHYTSAFIESTTGDSNMWLKDSGLLSSVDPNWPNTETSWKIVPEGLGHILRKIKDEYSNPPIYIMENGVSDSGILEDKMRIQYISGYMKEMLKAIKDDGCNVKAYTVWSLLDNFEWSEGYTKRFGLVQVDFNNPNRTRTLKQSAYWLQKVIRNRKL